MTLNSSYVAYDHTGYYCSASKARLYIIYAVGAVRSVIILPLCTFVLYLGSKQWQRQRSFNSASHSDFFVYQLAVIEMFWVVGFLSYTCGHDSQSFSLTIFGLWSSTVTFYGELFFHMLTCVERYLAVVHPVAYLGLRNSRGIRLRNMVTACVWLLCFVMASMYGLVPHESISIVVVPFLAVCIMVIFFCSVCAVCVLIRPGPGEGGGERERVNQSKQRALHTITAILGVLWLWFIGALVSVSLSMWPLLDESIVCVVSASLAWFNLPTSMVSPLLYLHKTGKLSCCHPTE